MYGGAPSAVLTVLSGRFQGLEILFNQSGLKTLMRSIPSLSWLFPHPEVCAVAFDAHWLTRIYVPLANAHADSAVIMHSPEKLLIFCRVHAY